MEGPGLISHILKKRETDQGGHPGTLNFKARVREATRIHKQNISMAARLDNVRPVYGKLFIENKHRTMGGSPVKSEDGKNKHNVPGLHFPKNLNDSNEPDTTRTDPTGGTKSKAISIKHLKTNSARDTKKDGNSGNNSARKPNVLLEYSKIQNGRVLDIAVIKEPFQDRYAIVGLDIDNGQRYELRLTSGEVSSILDGDILVTSLDNVEVWFALLNKVTLKQVDAFSKLAVQQSASNMSNIQPFEFESKLKANVESNLEPEAPSTNRPTTRPGGRGSRSQARVNNESDSTTIPLGSELSAEVIPDSIILGDALGSTVVSIEIFICIV